MRKVRAIWLGVELVELGEDGSLVVCGVPLKRKPLANLRQKAQRCRAWFSSLKESQRKLVNLVIMTVEKVRSPLLASVLEPIIKRLLDAMEGTQKGVEAVRGRVAYLMRKEGRSLALKLSRIAQGWGNSSAASWSEDKGFIQYLTVMNLPGNKPP